MFAILETGGKQYKVEAGDIIEVETIEKSRISKDNVVNFDHVLLIKDKELILGQPFIKNGNIEARILEESKSPKVIIFKKKSKKGYRRTRWHRQHLHRIQIEKIEIRTADKAEKKDQPAPKPAIKAEAKPEKKTAAPKTVKKTVAPRKKPEARTTKKATEKEKKTAAASTRKTAAAKKKEK
jgi:large subunit ribosomal protein L21